MHEFHGGGDSLLVFYEEYFSRGRKIWDTGVGVRSAAAASTRNREIYVSL